MLAMMDGRTKAAMLLRTTYSALVAHCTGSPSGTPSATQAALIERACQLTLRLAKMDQGFAATGAQSDHSSRVYLAWSNSLTRTLSQLGMSPTAPRVPTLAEHLAAKAAAKSRGASA